MSDIERLMANEMKVKLDCPHGGDWIVVEVNDPSAVYCDKCEKEVPATLRPVKSDTDIE